MKIIVEGIDAVGKTTQIDWIIKYFKREPFIKLHSYAPPKGDKQYQLNYEKRLYPEMFTLWTSYKNIICDRAHLGVKVYGQLYRGYTKQDLEWVDMTESWIKDKTILIVLIDEPQRVIDRDIKRGDNQSHSLDLHQKALEIEAFKKAFNESKIEKKLLINISEYTSIEEVTAVILEYIERKETEHVNN